MGSKVAVFLLFLPHTWVFSSPSDEFRNHMVNILPKHENFSGCECDTFSLSATFDEFVIFVTSRVELVLMHLSNDGKVVSCICVYVH